MKRGDLRRRCSAVVAGLSIPVPFEVATFCDQLSRERGRPIHRLAMDLPAGGPCGLVVSLRDADLVLYERRLSPVHQLHVVLHELGHLLLGHHLRPVITEDASRLLLPHIDPAVVRRVLARTRYSAPDEREAETVASLILATVSRRAGEDAWDEVPADQVQMTTRVSSSLRGRRQRLSGSCDD